MEENYMPLKQTVDSSNAMEILARIALEDQAEKILDKKAKQSARDAALLAFHKTEEDKAKSDFAKAAACDHLLGNHRRGVRPRHLMCALHKGHLSNKTVRIYCGKCRFEWHPGDKVDIYYAWEGPEGTPERKRVAKPNPTKKGWREINEFFYSFENAEDLTSRAFRIERVEPEDLDAEPDSPQPVAAA
jgi:hypothetical protein